MVDLYRRFFIDPGYLNSLILFKIKLCSLEVILIFGSLTFKETLRTNLFFKECGFVRANFLQSWALEFNEIVNLLLY